LRAAAGDLFDTGRWDDLVETTHLRYGVWGCAYLEALLRAADGQISQEGR
jgi:CRISPR-associated endonuclease/helicase Cas3